MGRFLEARISIPCMWCPGYRAFGVALLLQNNWLVDTVKLVTRPVFPRYWPSGSAG